MIMGTKIPYGLAPATWLRRVGVGLAAAIIFQSTLLSANQEEDIAAIKVAREASNQAIAAHDAAAVASFWDEEYVISVSSGEIEHGAEESEASFAQHFEKFPDVLYVRTPSEIIISETYPLAWEQGTWVGTVTNENGSLKKGGSYSSAWHKVDGVWKIRSELFVGIHCEGPGC